MDEFDRASGDFRNRVAPVLPSSGSDPCVLARCQHGEDGGGMKYTSHDMHAAVVCEHTRLGLVQEASNAKQKVFVDCFSATQLSAIVTQL